jgi:DASH complex subunit DAD1
MCSQSLESVLTQINSLNRSLEGIIEIGNEFASVEALWSQFETVMGRTEEEGANGEEGAAQDEEAREEQPGTGMS